ncbi:hypothetical protein [Fischerella thermalis]|uniref:hypothetical protein n=1 Tax=Fischerella thermalis TaxID=372787 RepID=UPI000C805D4B|nr:hypothetical protein [Fischerella thermalis]PLZ15759.1 hypothetical protein CBP17_01050 [Fischerella thermalis WC114]PLZ18237.1 hypothetical protein CBP30_17815 [Fischerella thermalis WC157]PLZ06635.1 hypothetical protein CBP19_19840 [Fischerella thermalis WC1110]PLZ35601.1 hypothetical protein CBP10_03070 [Fischerella thermalis WC558]PLZ43652.1 hypothetical protein CBP26_04595 [Fischerella thermalis WC538]
MPHIKEVRAQLSLSNEVTNIYYLFFVGLCKKGIENEPPRRQERQELSFSIRKENKIILLSLQRHFVIYITQRCHTSGNVTTVNGFRPR